MLQFATEFGVFQYDLAVKADGPERVDRWTTLFRGPRRAI